MHRQGLEGPRVRGLLDGVGVHHPPGRWNVFTNVETCFNFNCYIFLFMGFRKKKKHLTHGSHEAKVGISGNKN